MKKTYIAPTELVVRMETTRSLLLPASIQISDEEGEEEYAKEERHKYCTGPSCWDNEW